MGSKPSLQRQAGIVNATTSIFVPNTATDTNMKHKNSSANHQKSFSLNYKGSRNTIDGGADNSRTSTPKSKLMLKPSKLGPINPNINPSVSNTARAIPHEKH